MEIFSARRLTNMGLIAAIYVVATMLCSSLAYGQVQFRIFNVAQCNVFIISYYTYYVNTFSQFFR